MISREQLEHVRKQQLPSTGKSEIIAVTSGKGGVGKSTISTNMAIALRKMGKKVLLVDADIHLGNIDLLMGIRSVKNISHVISEEQRFEEIIIKGPGDVDILPAASAALELIEMEDIVLRRLAQAFSEFILYYDIILLDTAAGIAQNVLSFLLSADKIIVVLTPDPAAISDAYAVIKVVKTLNPNIPLLLTPNMVTSREEGEVLFKKMNLMTQKFLKSRIILGSVLLKDDMVAQSVKKRRPYILDYPNAAPVNAIKILNRRLIQSPIIERNKNANIFDRIRFTKKVKLEWNQ